VNRAWRKILVACLACIVGMGHASEPSVNGAASAFPYPGRFTNVDCRLDLGADGAFRMEGHLCPFPEAVFGPDEIVLWYSGRARVHGDHLQLRYADAWPADAPPHQEFVIVRCDGGPRFVADEERRSVALAIHSGDPSALWYEGGFVRSIGDTGVECDPEPLGPALAQLARRPPTRAVIRTIESTTCPENDADGEDCHATFRLDRIAGEALVQGMGLYFSACDMPDTHSMTVALADAGSATVDAAWRPADALAAERLVGAEVTTRMPDCVIASRKHEAERRHQETEEDHE